MELKLILQELLANLEVVYDLIVRGRSFVWSTPSATNEVKLPSFHKSLDLFFHGSVLFVVPHVKVLGLSVSKGAVLIEKKLQNGCIKDIGDAPCED